MACTAGAVRLRSAAFGCVRLGVLAGTAVVCAIAEWQHYRGQRREEESEMSENRLQDGSDFLDANPDAVFPQGDEATVAAAVREFLTGDGSK